MYSPKTIATDDKPALYGALKLELQALTHGEPDLIANLANAAALIFHALPAVNWAGFYLMRQDELVLGPFQGKPACIRIAVGRGVCGTAAAKRQTVLVPNVHHFPGHIACDAASNSEVVVPMIKDGDLVGVLDIDSPQLDRFDQDDARGLEALVEVLMQA